MTTVIYYFTGTGNSLYIARRLGESLGDCRIESMARQPPALPVGGPDESIGFVFPVHGWGMPRIVRQFAESLDIRKGTYCFAVANYMGLKFDTLGLLDDVLRLKGAGLAYGYGIKQPGNSIANYGGPSPEKTRKIIEAANVKIDRAARAIANKEVRHVRRFGTRISQWGNPSIYKDIEKFDEPFTATERCTGCGICSKVCPVGNVKIEDGKPAWQHRCERCMACIQWCPQEAIQYGQKTIKRRRYHNPGITAKDIIDGNNPGTSI